MHRFQVGDRVRRIDGHDNNVVKLGRIYTVAWVSSGSGADIRLDDCGTGHYYSIYFEPYVDDVTPGELFNTIANFTATILRERPIKVGDRFTRIGGIGIRRNVLAIHENCVWLGYLDSGVGPATTTIDRLRANFTRVIIQ